MSTVAQFIFNLTLMSSALSLAIELKLALILMLAGSIIALVILCLKRFHFDGRSRTFHWWAWACHGLLLIAVYMATFGVANIVGSGRKFSARMAVSTLRTLHWAERQCINAVGDFCTIGEMKLESPSRGLKTALLRSDFQRVIEGESGLPLRPKRGEKIGGDEFGLLGQYLIMLRQTPERGAKSWIAYAWPSTDRTLQTFCIDHSEEILELPTNDKGEALYLGLDRRPEPNACLGDLHANPNPPLTDEMKRALKAGVKPPPHVHQGQDNNTWQRWRGKRTRISKSQR